MRLDLSIAELHPDISRSVIAKLIASGRVTINGVPSLKASQNVVDSDDIRLDRLDDPNYSAEITDFAKRYVIYENNDVVVVNKPAGMLTHAKGGIANEFTVADFVKSKFDRNDVDDEGNNRLGIVHRLDRLTSGIMICAKNRNTASQLQKQFSNRLAHKTYIALIGGVPKHLSARIDLPIARNPSRPSTFRIDAKGKSAITNYRVEHIYDDNTCLVELKPLTGRTHQLRVHLSYIGNPIVGDPIYGSGNSSSRLLLHAYQLEITIPIDGVNTRKTFTAPLPNDFIDMIKAKNEVN